MINDPVAINQYYPVSRIRQLLPGQIKEFRLLEEDLVLWRDLDGEPHVWADRCVVTGDRLTAYGRVTGSHLVCREVVYDGEGRVLNSESTSTKRVPVYKVLEASQLVFASLGEPSQPPYKLPNASNAEFLLVDCGPYSVRASAARTVENFLDFSHFPYVHRGYLGDEPRTEVKDYKVEITDEGLLATGIVIWNPRGTAESSEGTESEYIYRVPRPFTVMLEKVPNTGDRLQTAIVLYAAPHEEARCTGYVLVTQNYGFGKPIQKMRDFHDMIFLQDREVLESQWPKPMPLDPRDELHQRADQSSIGYRRWLKQLGLRYGTVDYGNKGLNLDQ